MELDVWHTGMEDPDEEERQARKGFGLPQKKQMIYYASNRDASSRVNINRYRAVQEYNVTSPWFVMELETENQKIVRIHSDYLIEMQKPSFFADMSSISE